MTTSVGPPVDRHRVSVARALVLLVGASLRRLLREGLVVRSMVWPGLVVIGTLCGTLGVAAVVRPGRDVVLAESAPAELAVELRSAGFDVRTVEDPGALVVAGDATLGTDGHTLWVYGTPSGALELEAHLRTWAATTRPVTWRPVPLPLPEARGGFARGDLVCGVLALLFVLYGLVFGLGSVARDRDDGTLEAELALPIPRWVGAFARWVASSVILAAFYAVSVAAIAAVLPVPGPWDVVRNGIAACGGGVAIGLAVVGTSGLRQGFSGPFAAGMTLATGLAGTGALGLTWLPIANLFAGGSGWSALAVATAAGLGAAHLYAWRVGVG